MKHRTDVPASSRFAFPLFLFLLIAQAASAQLIIYSDYITNGFADYSWATHDVNNTSPVHGDGKSMSVHANFWEGISFHHGDMSTAGFTNFSFWAHGGTTGGQRLRVYGETGNGVAGPTYDSAPALVANTWQQIIVPLTTLGIANVSNFNRITIQLTSFGNSNAFYLDDIQISGAPPPPVYPSNVNLSVNASLPLQTVNERHFGVNLAIWDNNYDPPFNDTTAALMREMGTTLVRMPGGSLSDEYHWQSNTSLSNTWQWATSFNDFLSATTNAGVQAVITVNYGTGTPEEAAAWVNYANNVLHLGYKYWEIGNECYGSWETDSNTFAHDPYTYATRASNYLAQMRAVDPTIKIGVVSVPGEDNNANGYSAHPAFNPRTSQSHNGWTPVMLTTLKSMGMTPDFLVHHVYPEFTDPNNPSSSSDDDSSLMQSSGNWAPDAANLRQMITDYVGAGGSNIDLVCTENNADAGAQGRQSTSLVNGLYYADSLAQLLKTEFRGFCWWDLRNGTDVGGYFGANLYGWRNYGDLGMINGLNTRHPTFYAAKLMQYFARPGDQIYGATSDYPWLSAYACRHTNGSMALLVLNKFNATNLVGQITLNGYSPSPTSLVRSYGIPNDEATRTNGPAPAQDLTTNSIANAGAGFSYNFAPLSMTLFTLVPSAPTLAAVPPATASQFVVQLQGQPSVPYVIQTSSDLNTWTSVSTNTMSGNTLNLTNATAGNSQAFWRAVWVP